VAAAKIASESGRLSSLLVYCCVTERCCGFPPPPGVCTRGEGTFATMTPDQGCEMAPTNKQKCALGGYGGERLRPRKGEKNECTLAKIVYYTRDSNPHIQVERTPLFDMAFAPPLRIPNPPWGCQLRSGTRHATQRKRSAGAAARRMRRRPPRAATTAA
jgi:hypothetical protein